MDKLSKKEYDAQYYLKNKDRINDRNYRWQKNNPEKIKIVQKRHYHKSGKGKQLEWARNNRDKTKMSKLRQKDKNPLKVWIYERISQWRNKPGPISDLTTEYLVDLFNKQNGRCYYTNEELLIWGGKVKPNTGSLDRLIPEKGYVQGNVVWCSFFVNTMKGRLGENEFYLFMQSILKNRGII